MECCGETVQHHLPGSWTGSELFCSRANPSPAILTLDPCNLPGSRAVLPPAPATLSTCFCSQALSASSNVCHSKPRRRKGGSIPDPRTGQAALTVGDPDLGLGEALDLCFHTEAWCTLGCQSGQQPGIFPGSTWLTQEVPLPPSLCLQDSGAKWSAEQVSPGRSPSGWEQLHVLAVQEGRRSSAWPTWILPSSSAPGQSGFVLIVTGVEEEEGS